MLFFTLALNNASIFAFSLVFLFVFLRMLSSKSITMILQKSWCVQTIQRAEETLTHCTTQYQLGLRLEVILIWKSGFLTNERYKFLFFLFFLTRSSRCRKWVMWVYEFFKLLPLFALCYGSVDFLSYFLSFSRKQNRKQKKQWNPTSIANWRFTDNLYYRAQGMSIRACSTVTFSEATAFSSHFSLITASFFFCQYINKTGFRACVKELFAQKHDPLSVSYAVLPGEKALKLLWCHSAYW